MLSPCHNPLAVPAADLTLEGIFLMLPYWLFLAASDDGLCQLKLFFADNGLVHPIDDNPVFLLLCNALACSDTTGLPLVSHGCAGVDIADQQLVDHSSCPAYFLAHPAELLFVGMLGAEILSRRRGVVIIQAKGNLRGVSAQQRLIENSADDVCRLRVKLELVADRGMQNITIGGITAHILALFHHLYFCRSGFDRELLAVCRVA